MHESSFSKELRRSILLHSTMSILTVGFLISLLGITLFYFKIKAELTDKLGYSLQIRTMTVNESLSRAQDIALQITSRSKLRQELEQYDDGQVTRAQLESFSAPLLHDAMRQSPDIAAISRLDASGRLAVAIGMPIPRAEWPIPKAGDSQVLIRGPLVIDGSSYLVIGAAILAKDGKRVGTDIVLFTTRDLRRILHDAAGLGEKGEALLGIRSGDGISLLVPPRGERTAQASAPLLPAASPIARAFVKGFAQKTGVITPDSESVIAYGPLANSGWALAIRMNKGEFYASLYHQIAIMVLATLLLIGAGYYVMIIVLRPLTKGILIKAEDLEDEIRKKTLMLEETAEALRDEKSLLKTKNDELGKAYGDLKSAQSQILQQEKMACVGLLAAGVAHEINTPLGFITSNLNSLGKYINRLLHFITLQAEALDGNAAAKTGILSQIEEQRKQLKLDMIVTDATKLVHESLEGTEKMLSIVRELRNFSRVDNVGWQTDDLNAGLESTVRTVWPILTDRAVVKKEYGDLPPVRCNLRELNQAFMNILLNAAQALEVRGEIIIKTWCDGSHAFIAISDNGCGIPVERIDRIFDPFFTTREVGEGAGLGLSIAYAIVQKHGGDIKVVSEVGKGTTIRILLPLQSPGDKG